MRRRPTPTSSPRSCRAPGESDYERYLRTDELLALQKSAGRVGAPRRAPLPDRAPVVGALAQARVDRGRGGDAADRGARRSRGALRLLRPRERARSGTSIGVPRAPRADVAVGVPGGAARARARLRLRLARLPRDPARLAAALRRVRRAAPRARALAARGLHAGPRARGSLPARRGADRLGRAGRRLALPPREDGRRASSARTSSARRARRSSCSPG